MPSPPAFYFPGGEGDLSGGGCALPSVLGVGDPAEPPTLSLDGGPGLASCLTEAEFAYP